jgi:hypothetical protein
MTTNSPFLALPAEIRLKVYAYFLPTVAHFSDSAGLRRTCREVRREFNYEAHSSMKRQYEQLRSRLAKEGVIVTSSLSTILATSTLDLSLRQSYVSSNVLKSQILPWRCLWLKNVVITFGSVEAMLGMSHILLDRHVNISLRSGLHITDYTSLPHEDQFMIENITLRPFRPLGVLRPTTWLGRLDSRISKLDRYNRFWELRFEYDNTGTQYNALVWHLRNKVDKWKALLLLVLVWSVPACFFLVTGLIVVYSGWNVYALYNTSRGVETPW